MALSFQSWDAALFEPPCWMATVLHEHRDAVCISRGTILVVALITKAAALSQILVS